MTESLPTVTSNHREYKVISSIDNDNSSHGFISNDEVDNNQDTTSDNNDLDDKILTMIRNHRYKYSSSSSYSTVYETVDMEINDDNESYSASASGLIITNNIQTLQSKRAFNYTWYNKKRQTE
jgi:hypothetical protein